MKRLLLAAFTTMTAMMLSSCIEEIQNKTVFHPDGSLTRTVTVRADSGAIARRDFKLRLDSTWHVTTARKDEKVWLLNATQEFSGAGAMTHALAGEPGKFLTATVQADKSFRWFFTVYSYTETWKCYRIINEEPLDKYISDADLDMLFRHEVRKEPYTKQDSVVLREKENSFDEWRSRNAFEAYYKAFLNGVETIHSARLTTPMVEEKKEALFAAANDTIQKDGKNIEGLGKVFAKGLATPVAMDAFRANLQGFKSVAAAFDFEESLWTFGAFKVDVTMPGVITATNAKSIEGNSAQWDDFLLMSLFRDTNLTVESRSVNWWAVATTGVVVGLILLYLGVALWRRRA